MKSVFTYHYDQDNDPVEMVFTTVQPTKDDADHAFVKEYLRVDAMLDEEAKEPTEEQIAHAHSKAIKSLHSVIELPNEPESSYKPSKSDEMILCSDAKPIRDLLNGKTFVSDVLDVETILETFSNNSSAQRRGNAEEDPSLKQLIPYVILKKGDSVFLYERLSGAGEKRLVGSSSVGIGGHMNLIADSPQGLVENIFIEASREIMEELYISSEIDLSRSSIYILNDESNTVGEVHLGAILVVDVKPSIEISVRETDQLRGGFVRFKDINPMLLENWSKMTLEKLGLLSTIEA